MTNPLKQMKYPGRGIVIGSTLGGQGFCAYFITGRSKSSQARRLVHEKNIIYTEPTDPETLAKGNPDLLLYNAIMWHAAGLFNTTVAISNGKQTDTVLAGTVCSGNVPLGSLTRQWNYEPDEPNYTPRISARVTYRAFEMEIIRRCADGTAEHIESKHKFKNGNAKLLTTYTGENVNPLPSADGNPADLSIESRDIGTVCNEIGDMLDPELRVCVAAILLDPGKNIEHAIKNYRG